MLRVEAELNRRYPDRVTMRPTNADGFREAWDILERLWQQTVERARGMAPELLDEQVEGEWSFIETLRHLVFATGAWVKRAMLGEPSPCDPLDLPHDEMSDEPSVPRDRGARPSLDEVLALRSDRMATVRHRRLVSQGGEPMSGIMTRWLVLQEHPVTEHELDADETISDEAVVRWVTAACAAYLEHCMVLRRVRDESGLVLRQRPGALPRGALLGRPTDVVVTASASEVRPSSFTISVRLRPGGGDRELPVNATCVIRLEDEVTGEVRELGDEIRDELIALEHSARQFN